MDSSTINPSTFTVTGPGATVVVGKVSYDVSGMIATFTPISPLAASTTFTATISWSAGSGRQCARDYFMDLHDRH